MLEYHIDFTGQQQAERLTQSIISAFGAIGFLVGIVLQDIRVSMYTFVAGVVVAGALVIPAWPYLNKNPVQWLASRERLLKETSRNELGEKDASS
ncbi:hypothetical protein DFQ27_004046 [Actinomortierella ambigua]|uniref:Signal peptidase complex subunit 1 n=1 Tax=Actinomortierella ambigua TaxID=1343610 RepID=A0A9P6Q645_9FUNG|nr:hypothetical protein DFQ27_004046 [Actinomortierella ambigua]